MSLFPVKTETLISRLTPRRIEKRLAEITARPSLKSNREDKNMIFQGKVGDLAFVISRRITHPNNFVPLVRGIIEPTKQGSIIFLKYTLFRSSLMFMVIAISIAVIMGTFFLLLDQSPVYAVIAFALAMANYLVTLLNFRKQVKITRNSLLEALNID